MRNIPNLLSLFRLLLVGVFIWHFVAGNYLPALSIYVLAFITDILDGYLARRNNWVTDLGKLLDPLADKLMTLAALGCIWSQKRSTIYLAVFLLMGAKELTLFIGGLVLKSKRDIIVHSDWPGKIATGLFTLGIALSLISFHVPSVSPWDQVTLYFAAGISCYALVYYAISQWNNLFPKWPLLQSSKPPQRRWK